MMLVSIELARPGVDLHTFECAICNRVHKTLAAYEDPMKSKGLGRWLQGDLHPPRRGDLSAQERRGGRPPVPHTRRAVCTDPRHRLLAPADGIPALGDLAASHRMAGDRPRPLLRLWPPPLGPAQRSAASLEFSRE
jgi:hypothetical protein